MTIQLPQGSWQYVGLLLHVYKRWICQFVEVSCTVDCVPGCRYIGFTTRQTIDSYVCSCHMSTELGKVIVTKLSFQKNPISICGSMMSVFLLAAVPVIATFKSALSNDIVAKNQEIWSGVWFRIMDDPMSYELRDISTATGTTLKCYSPKSFTSFKVSQEQSFSRILASSIAKTVRDFHSASTGSF